MTWAPVAIAVLLRLTGVSLFPSPQAAATLPPGVPYAAPTDAIRIVSVTFSPANVRAGQQASAVVLTTSNAAAMIARIGTYQVNVPRVAIGTFAVSLRVPHPPWPVYRARVVLTAIRADGVSTQRTASLTVHY